MCGYIGKYIPTNRIVRKGGILALYRKVYRCMRSHPIPTANPFAASHIELTVERGFCGVADDDRGYVPLPIS